MSRKKSGFLVQKVFTFFFVILFSLSPTFDIWLTKFIPLTPKKVMASEVETFTTSGTWTVPTGVTQVIVELWAGGGGGASGGGGNAQGNGGGGGGQYVKSTVTISQGSYSYVVGAAGTGGTAGNDNATAGENSTFGGTLVVAIGGSKGNRVAGGGGTGGAGGTGGTGTLKYNGGNGANGATNLAGGGGGGAGSTGIGKNASGTTAGGATTEYGGAGGDGTSANNGSGSVGNVYGGGGGSSTRTNAGRNGASGFVRLTYEYTITSGYAGTQISELQLGSTDSHIGGAFTFKRNYESATITQIVISETGTINANSYLSDLKLYYKTESTCSSTVPGDATLFNSTGVGFSSSKATATGSMTIGTSQVCVYVVLDVSSGASVGDTILIEITNPSTDVTVNDGLVAPATAVAIPGTTTLIAAGFLSVDIVDGSGNSVTSPYVDFTGKVFSWVTMQSTATLGVSSQKIRVSNDSITPQWTLSIAATGGASATWTSTPNTYKYNGIQSEGRLRVDPSSSTITPLGSCSNTGLSTQSAAYFVSGSVDSINLVVASGSATTHCEWDITGIGLTQDIPAEQPPGSYSISMTITVM